jgi:hypothetical protein
MNLYLIKKKTENDLEIKSKGEILIKGLAESNDPLPPMFDPSAILISEEFISDTSTRMI